MKELMCAIMMLFTTLLIAQTTVTGTVTDEQSGQPIPGTNVKIIGTSLGTSTDFDGNFSFDVSQSPPFTIEISRIGYASTRVEVTSNNQTVDVSLTETATPLDEIVISASRTPESVRESPVTIERMDIRDIKQSASASFYNSIENLKGVDVNTSSLTFNSVNTRGFATFQNLRFVQLVDGMDNSSPVLNFAVGNLVGINELDVKSIELIPGASSALYGANAFNGILFLTSKSPFDQEGISVYVKNGITSSDAAGDDDYTDVGIRAAYKFSDKFAAKASFSYLDGTDWNVTDDNQYTTVGAGLPDAITAAGSPGHNGLNLYGDEISLEGVLAGAGVPAGSRHLQTFIGGLIAGGQLPPSFAGLLPFIPQDNVSVSPYKETDLTDHQARSAKTDISLNYRPNGDDFEIIWNSRIGFGNTIYQGTSRFQLENFIIRQHKLEIKDDNFFIRGYVTSETAGDSYNINNTGFLLARSFATPWYGQYVAGYLGGLNQVMGSGGNPLDPATISNLHVGARQFADQNARLNPGTPEFQAAFNKITTDGNVNTGSLFLDDTKSYTAEGNYNFKSLLNDAMDLQVGGNYKVYSLNSGGTIFTDADGSIEYNEFGAYVQGIKKFLEDDRLKVTASVRLDKNEFFDENISPRVSFNYSVGENKQHNFRASFQTGFRNPDTQTLFIGLNLAAQGIILAGGSPDNLDRALPGTTTTARDVYENTNGNVFSLASLIAGSPVSAVTALPKEEQVTAFDVGYRGTINKVSIDLNVYFNDYKDFLSQTRVGVVDGFGNVQPFQIFKNSAADITTFGAIIGLSTKIGDGFRIGTNYTYSDIDFDQTTDPDFQAGFNTPKHKVKFSIGNTHLFENFGFNINARWSDSYLWEATFASGFIPARTTVDAQINYSIPSLKSVIKIGATNIGGDDYTSAIGSGNVGSQFFASLTINN